ncbi:hypothetical protein CTAYLR_010373 [Chrysophaeum taylorii]|uniref:Elongation of fatty acids protein n=1 Tax=Chrysophaeum taylorii TaxID=2483200 RepID=A0AAD7XNL4_9STRA|nr:hypothetical protein CTAYLR_010373 [Chrysophaeum taylorii]
MFAAVVAEAFARARIEGSWGFVFCELPEAPRSVAFEAYYVSKYYELLDTVLAFGCKGKRPRHYWMHCYHHCLVLFMAYFYTKGQTLRYPGMAFNTFVHVFMYYYYSRAALGLRSPWKAWITRLQVLQFVTSFIFLILALRRTPNLLFPGSACAGRRALAFNCVFNFTLLLLFLQILFSQPSVRRRRRSSSSKEA